MIITEKEILELAQLRKLKFQLQSNGRDLRQNKQLRFNELEQKELKSHIRGAKLVRQVKERVASQSN